MNRWRRERTTATTRGELTLLAVSASAASLSTVPTVFAEHTLFPQRLEDRSGWWTLRYKLRRHHWFLRMQDRRTRTSASVTVRVVSIRLATSATSTAPSPAPSTLLPTVSRAIGPPNHYKYWWLRSPMTGGDVSEFLVISSGNIYFTDDSGSSVYNNSYGRSYNRRALKVGMWHQLQDRMVLLI